MKYLAIKILPIEAEGSYADLILRPEERVTSRGKLPSGRPRCSPERNPDSQEMSRKPRSRGHLGEAGFREKFSPQDKH